MIDLPQSTAILSQAYQDLMGCLDKISSQLGIATEKGLDCDLLAKAALDVKRSIYEQESKLFSGAYQPTLTANALESTQVAFYKSSISQVEQLLCHAAWEKSTYTREIAKQVQLASGLLYGLIQPASEVQSEEDRLKNFQNAEQTQIIYVSLYCTTGELSDWERLLSQIEKQVTFRPILTSEAKIKAWIRAKKNTHPEAYVTLRVRKENVLYSNLDEAIQSDRADDQFVTLKDSRIFVDSIESFVHENCVYTYQNGKLVSKSL